MQVLVSENQLNYQVLHNRKQNFVDPGSKMIKKGGRGKMQIERINSGKRWYVDNWKLKA